MNIERIEMEFFADTPKWLDTRLFKPNCYSYDIYNILVYDGHSISNGRCEWMPCDAYTDGNWVKMWRSNGGILTEGIVLFFKQHERIEMVFPSCTPDIKRKSNR